MSSINRNRPLAATDLKHKIIFWKGLQSSPKYLICPFAVNLLTLRRNLADNATPSAELNEFLNDNFYLAESATNPGNLTIGELYEAGISVDTVFDPLNASNMAWGRLRSCAQRQDTPVERIKMDQIETKLVLYSNHEKQRQLIERLKEKEKEYAKNWIVFSRKMANLWNVAFVVCLGGSEKTELLIQNLPNDLYEWVFLSNHNNCWAYLIHVSQVLEGEKKITPTMEQIKCVLGAMERVVHQDSCRELRNEMIDDLFINAVKLISRLWSDFWENDVINALLNTPLTRALCNEAQAFDKLLQKEGGLLAGPDCLFGNAGADYIRNCWESANQLITKWNELTAHRAKLNLTSSNPNDQPGPIGELDKSTMNEIRDILGKLQACMPVSEQIVHENT